MKHSSCILLLLILVLCCVLELKSRPTELSRAPPIRLNSQYYECCGALFHHSRRHNISVSDDMQFADHLWACIAKASAASAHQIMRDMYSTSGPILRVTLVTYSTAGIVDFSAYAAAINAAYAQINGYSFFPLNESAARHLISNDGNEADERWYKVKLIERAIGQGGWATDSDYVAWFDADLIVLRFEKRVEQLMASFPKAHIIMCAEHAGSSTLVNSGSIIVKNSRWAAKLLVDWWADTETRQLYSDQEQFDILYTRMMRRSTGKELLRLQQRVVILPPNAFNSDPPAMTRQQQFDPVLHLMGEHAQYRKHVFRSGFMAICSSIQIEYPQYAKDDIGIVGSEDTSQASVNDESSIIIKLDLNELPPQLGLSQELLLYWTWQIYGPEAAALMQKYSSYLQTSEQFVEDGLGLVASRQLANSVHHFAFAVENSPVYEISKLPKDRSHMPHRNLSDIINLFDKFFTSSDDDLRKQSQFQQGLHFNMRQLRVMVFEALCRSVLLQKRAHRISKGLPQTIVPPRDWPEMLKTAVTAGQHLLQVNDELRSQMNSRCSIAHCMASMLNEIFQVCHPQQRGAVLLMLAHLHEQVGQLNLFDYEKLQHFEWSDGDYTCILPASTSNAHLAAAVQRAAPRAASHSFFGQEEETACCGSICLTSSDSNVNLFTTNRISSLQALLINFETSLQMTREVAKYSGEHILVTPLMLTANALSLHSMFDDAFDLYEEALFIQRRLSLSRNTVTLLLNYAIALTRSAERNNCVRAVELLMEAEQLIGYADAVARISINPISQKVKQYLPMSKSCATK